MSSTALTEATSSSLPGTYPVAKLIAFVTDRPGHDWRYAIDTTKIRRELGFKPNETFEKGIEKTVEWYLTNQNWWQPLLDHRS